MKKIALLCISALSIAHMAGAQEYILESPDQQLSVNIMTNDGISFSVDYKDINAVNINGISMELAGGDVLGLSAKVKSETEASVKELIEAPLSTKSSLITDEYNTLTLKFKGNYALEFRAYKHGFAYRFITNINDDLIIKTENMRIDYGPGVKTWFPEEEALMSHYERMYIYADIDTIKKEKFCSLPLLTGTPEGLKVLFTESDLDDYPNMFLEKSGSTTFDALFPGYVLEALPKPGSEDRDELLTAADYIARTKGKRSFPWRVFIIGEDSDIVESSLVYQLASPSKVEDQKWIKPGQIAWDWYNANNIYGVDFESGLNTETYKYFIDFASENGIEYIILDEGWSRSTTDITSSNDVLDVKELVRYGREKAVRIILWVLWKPLNQDITGILTLYKDWGIAGIKVDFMQRADQQMVNYYKAVGMEAARHELLVDFHGAYKPSGLHREYPNVITFEGVKGEENNKWSQDISPEHNLTLPFTRMVAGPMDYTPGAMSNAHLINHKISFERPEALGTRSHEIAKYVIFESPLQMLCDTPSRYKKEMDCTRFITQIPQVWDETRVLEARVADYLVLARRSGDSWYIGAMTDWTARSFDIPLDFLPDGEYELQIMKDGANAERYAEDYLLTNSSCSKQDTLKAKLVSGGGWTAIIKKK
jgi:alpha-glucosidase